MKLRFASYNIHKAVGLDRKRDPERIVAVLRELHADIIALQEADRRIGAREAVLPRHLFDESPWRIVPVAKRARSMGWHGNALLVRRDLEIAECHALEMPTIEPRGAACAVIGAGSARFRVIGTHLDLSGLRRRDQVKSLIGYASTQDAMPSVILGDFNQWGHTTGAMREFAGDWGQIAPGPSYPSRRPIARLDRIVHSGGWRCEAAHVHHSALAAVASDHLPIYADLSLGG
nr:endonuclease/exonuclease/phosphatase family protein [Qipengyuania sediminis]